MHARTSATRRITPQGDEGQAPNTPIPKTIRMKIQQAVSRTIHQPRSSTMSSQLTCAAGAPRQAAEFPQQAPGLRSQQKPGERGRPIPSGAPHSTALRLTRDRS
jgi:hypothetical protein